MPSNPQQKFHWHDPAPPIVRLILQTGSMAVAPWVVLFASSPHAKTLNGLLGGGFFLFALFVVWSHLASPDAQDEPGIALAYVLAGTSCIEGLFALGFWMMSVHSPGAFDPPLLSRIDAAYYSISTATTTGMGDIHPKSGPARLLATGQMVSSVFLVAGGIAIALPRYLASSTRFSRERTDNHADDNKSKDRAERFR